MRILRIEVEGFMPFREPQVIDLGETNLFALVGPTGSGKSSLLDAVTFALYGKTPRWGGGNPARQLVSQSRSRARVGLEFEARGRRYQAVREVSVRAKTSSHEADFRCWQEDDWKPVSEERLTMTQTTDEIVRVVGMNYDTFIKTLLLPQGQFDRLLKPDKPRERREMLMDLAGLGIYDRMFEAAGRRVTEAQATADQLRAVVEEYGDCTPEAIELARRQAAEAAQAEKQALAACKSSEERLAVVRRGLELQARLEKLDATLACLEARRGDVDSQKERLERSRRLAGERVKLDAVDRIRGRVQQLESELLEAQEKAAGFELALRAAQDALQQAEEQAADLPGLEERRERLAELLGKAERHLALTTESRGHETKMNELSKRLAKTADGLKEARAKDEQLASHQSELRDQLEKLEVDEEALSTCELGLDRAGRLRTVQARVVEREQEVTAAAEWIARLTSLFDETREEVERCESARESCEAELEKARLALARAREQQAVAVLRTELRCGEECPVCLQSVSHVPDVPSAPELEEATAGLARCEKALKQGMKSLETARRAHEDAARERDRAEHQLENVRVSLAEAVAEGERLRQDLLELLDWENLPDDPVAELERRRARLKSQAEKLRNLGLELEEVGCERARVQSELAGLVADEKNLREQHASVADMLESRREELTGLTDELGEALGVEGDFVVAIDEQRKEIGARVQTLRTNLAAAREALQERERQAEGARAACSERERTLQKERKEQADREEGLQRLIEQHGYPDEGSLRADLLDDKVLEELRAELEAYERQVKTTHDGRDETLAQLGDQRFDAEQGAEAESAFEAARTAAQEASRRLGELTGAVKNLEERAQASAELQNKLSEARLRLETYKTLHSLLDARNLKQYVASYLLDSILERASSHLETLSGRYRLELNKKDEIFVVDSWNADESRDVRSLSGGETFLASLSLALALVDYLSQGTPLESLFIDEGFGTLDRETLEVVAQTLEQLQEKGRLVGIITHVMDLAERFPVRFEVRKAQTGSAVRSPVG